MSNDKPKTALAQLMDSVKKSHNEEDTGAIATAAPTAAVKTDTQNNDNTGSAGYLVLQHIDPELCQPWDFADRPEDEMGDIESLTESIKAHGQQEPVLMRQATKARGNTQYEIIFGNRRWRACKQAGVKMLAIVKPLTDQEAALYQKEENENRKDLSDLARARSYKMQLAAGMFKSEKELSDKLGISRQNLNDILAYTRLPSELVERLPNLRNISRKTVVKMSVMAKEKKKLKCLITLGQRLNMRKITSANLEKNVEKMMNPRGAKAAKPNPVTDANGKPIFTIAQGLKGDTTIKINARMRENYDVVKLKIALQEYLMDCRTNKPS